MASVEQLYSNLDELLHCELRVHNKIYFYNYNDPWVALISVSAQAVWEVEMLVVALVCYLLDVWFFLLVVSKSLCMNFLYFRRS
jgi:hypothetical protein